MAISETRFKEVLKKIEDGAKERDQLVRAGDKDAKMDVDDNVFAELANETDPKRIEDAINALSVINNLPPKGQTILDDLRMRKEANLKAEQQQQAMIDGGKKLVGDLTSEVVSRSGLGGFTAPAAGTGTNPLAALSNLLPSGTGRG